MPKQKRSVTITEVANLAGVSISTVSRVLNKPHIVRADTRERVQQAIEEMNFIPDPMARGLGSRNIRTVAVVVPNIINSSMAEIVRGATETLREHHADTLLFNSNEDPEVELRHYQYLTENMIHGVIFITHCGADVDFGRIAGSMPVVLVDREETHPQVDTFIVDDHQAVDIQYLYLKGLGHEHIGMVAGNRMTMGAQRRVRHFRRVLEEDGRTLDEDRMITYCPWTMEGGRDAFLELTEKMPEVTAMICNNDLLALGVLGAAYERGVRVPEDISVIGADNCTESAYLAPTLTTLNYPSYEIGRRSANAVIERFGDMHRRGGLVRLPLQLLERKSCGAPRTGPLPAKQE